jgi:hypothetical protein
VIAAAPAGANPAAAKRRATAIAAFDFKSLMFSPAICCRHVLSSRSKAYHSAATKICGTKETCGTGKVEQLY